MFRYYFKTKERLPLSIEFLMDGFVGEEAFSKAINST